MAITLLLALVVAGCRPYGPGTPWCGEVETVTVGDEGRLVVTTPGGAARTLSSVYVIQAQAVPDADVGLCIGELPSGWQVSTAAVRSGAFELRLTHPGLGISAVTATLTPTCTPDPQARVEQVPDAPERRRYVAVTEQDRGVAVVVIPVAPRHEQAGHALARDLAGRELGGQAVRATLRDTIHGSAERRIETALAAGAAALVIDDSYLLRDDLELRLPGQGLPVVSGLGGVLAELADRVEVPRYAATWWELGPDSCTTLTIDARGPAAADLADRLPEMLGRFPLGELRRQLDDLGLHVEPLP